MGDDKRTDEKTRAKDAAAAPAGEPAGAGEATSNVAPFAATGRGKPCPICGRPSIVEMRPFCSKRCADIDLGRWLGEVYRVPTSDRPSSDDESPAPNDKPDEP